MTGTRVQLRAVCPCCFGRWAWMPGLSQHGYTRKHGWNMGPCRGQHGPHFGTAEGLAVAIGEAERIRMWADDALDRSVRVCSGADVLDIYDRKIEAPTPYQRERYSRRLLTEARQARATADDIMKRCDDWQPAEPVQVAVKCGKVTA